MDVQLLARNFNLTLAIALILPALFSTSALADDKKDCNNGSIRACTALIASGKYGPDDTATSYYNRGVAYSNGGDLDSAISDYDKAIAIDPSDAQYFYNRGWAYQGKSDYDRAIRDYDKALALDPKKTEAYFNRGSAYAQKGKPGRAIEDYNRVIALTPRDSLIYGKRGSAYMDLRRYDLAVADFRKSLSIDPRGRRSAEIRFLLNNLESKLKGKPAEGTDRKFTLYQNTDFIGALLDEVDAGSAAECEAACVRNQACRAYSFNVWNSLCFLKAKPTFRLLEPSTVSGLKNKAEQPPKSSAAITMVRYRGKAFPGMSFAAAEAEGFEACESRCEANDACVAFSFVKDASTCKLFDKAGEYSSKSGVDSGAKRQAAN